MRARRIAAAAAILGVIASTPTQACSSAREPGVGSTSVSTSVARPPATTIEQLCEQQAWPRPLPDVIGRLLHQTIKVGPLGCWTDVRAVAAGGGTPGNGEYRIAAITPPPGTPVHRNDAVTVHVVEAESTTSLAFHPCDWVTVDEAAAVLGSPAQATPRGDQLASVDIECSYSTGAGGNGMTSELRLPDSFPVDAASQFALTTAAGNAAVVDGIGLRAQCVYEPTTTPPSTTLQVLLTGARIYRITGWYGLPCDQLKTFAQTAIGRIGA